jgi:Cu/Ag efflux protein CusF
MFAGLICVGLPSVMADPGGIPHSVYRSLESGKSSHDAGHVRGRIEDIDYSSGTIVVKSSRGIETISVVPNTAIYHGSDYATIGDLRRGDHVEISVYEVDGRLVAQMIRLK